MDGARARGRACVAVCGGALGGGEGGLPLRDAAAVAAPGRAGRGRPARADERGARAHQRPRAREPRAAPEFSPDSIRGQRDPERGIGMFRDGGARPPTQDRIAFIDEFAMVPPSVRGPWRTRRPRGRADAPIESGHKSAVCCRSPRRPATRMSPRGVTRAGALPAGAATTRLAVGDRACACRELRALTACARFGGSCAAKASRSRGSHRGTADAGHGVARCRAREGREDDGPEPGCAVPAGQGDAPVPRDRTRSALGQRLHLRRHLERRRSRRARHRPRTDGGRGSLIDASARRIVGWRVSRSATAGFVLDALEQAIHERRPATGAGLVAHSDRGSQGGLNRSSQRF